MNSLRLHIYHFIFNYMQLFHVQCAVYALQYHIVSFILIACVRFQMIFQQICIIIQIFLYVPVHTVTQCLLLDLVAAIAIVVVAVTIDVVVVVFGASQRCGNVWVFMLPFVHFFLEG